MPLDSPLKTTHVQNVLTRTLAGRTKTVIFVSESGGVYSYTPQTVVFRRMDVIDPQIPNNTGGPPKPQVDARMRVDISIPMTGILYIADTSTATAGAVAAADKFEIIEATPAGILPGGTHWAVDLRRFR